MYFDFNERQEAFIRGFFLSKGFNKREIEIIYLKLVGYPTAEAAKIMGIGKSGASAQITTIKNKLNLGKGKENPLNLYKVLGLRNLAYLYLLGESDKSDVFRVIEKRKQEEKIEKEQINKGTIVLPIGRGNLVSQQPTIGG